MKASMDDSTSVSMEVESSSVEQAVGQAVSLLKGTSVEQLVKNLSRRLIEVPFNGTVQDTLTTMQAHDILAVAVAAPPGHWIGAGGTQILEADRVTGAPRKHYIGMVSVIDILVHISGEHAQLNAPVSNVIGHSLEGLNLWTFGPQTSVFDAIEHMSMGVHRVLVPFHSDHSIAGVEMKESSPGYHILTQTDVLQFIQDHGKMIEGIMKLSIAEVGAVKRSVFAAPHAMPVMTALRCMAKDLLPAVAIVQPDPNWNTSSSTLINGEGMKLIGTFSASDLRFCAADDALSSWSSISVLEWCQKVSVQQNFGTGAALGPETNLWKIKAPVTCRLSTSLGDVITLALHHHTHRVWVTDEEGALMGLAALSDLLSVFHK